MESEPAFEEEDGVSLWPHSFKEHLGFSACANKSDPVAVCGQSPHEPYSFIPVWRIEPDSSKPFLGKRPVEHREMGFGRWPRALDRRARIKIEFAESRDYVRRGEPFVLAFFG